MVRLGTNFACAALLATALAIPACYAVAATTAQSPGTAQTTTSAPAATPAKATSAQPTRTHHKKKAEPVAEVPQTPPPPPTLEQQSPTAPQVSYRNGLLTIDAPNSTLSSILRAVQSQTGATMDVPSGAGSDRVAMRLGPGQPRDVLNTLLNGTKFDYMILGVAGQPGAVQRVILTPKLAGGATTQAANAPQPTASDEPQDDTSADAGGESEYPGGNEQAPVAPGAFRRPMGAPGGQAFQQSNGEPTPPMPFAQPNDPNIVKTPEQLMQELQQMQQQQQQYQEQLNPANQNPQ
jgi:hypothetical protein